MSHQLEQHLASLGIRLGSAALVREGEGGPFAVVAATHIPALAVVASAPKTATLSPRTSALAQHLNTLPSALASPALQLATCVLFETLLGERSRWSVYLAHLPHDLSTVAGVWDSDGIPMAWVRGTELEKELQRVGVSHVCSVSCSHHLLFSCRAFSRLYQRFTPHTCCPTSRHSYCPSPVCLPCRFFSARTPT